MQTAEFDQPSPQHKPGRSFDSLAFAKRLQAGGVFSREQAEILAEEQAALIDERLATKDDIAAVRADLEALRITTKADLETGLANTRADLIKWMVGVSVAQAGLIIGILKMHG
jgi:hypothetical protein